MKMCIGLLFELFHHISKSAHIMSCITYNSRVGTKGLPTTFQVCIVHHVQKSLCNILRSNIPPLVDKQFGNGYYSFDVFLLVGTLKVGCKRSFYVIGKNNRSIHFFSFCCEDGSCFLLIFTDYYRHILFDNTSFFKSYFRQCIS